MTTFLGSLSASIIHQLLTLLDIDQFNNLCLVCKAVNAKIAMFKKQYNVTYEKAIVNHISNILNNGNVMNSDYVISDTQDDEFGQIAWHIFKNRSTIKIISIVNINHKYREKINDTMFDKLIYIQISSGGHGPIYSFKNIPKIKYIFGDIYACDGIYPRIKVLVDCTPSNNITVEKYLLDHYITNYTELIYYIANYWKNNPRLYKLGLNIAFVEDFMDYNADRNKRFLSHNNSQITCDNIKELYLRTYFGIYSTIHDHENILTLFPNIKKLVLSNNSKSSHEKYFNNKILNKLRMRGIIVEFKWHDEWCLGL